MRASSIVAFILLLSSVSYAQDVPMLIAQLGSANFSQREAAQKQLTDLATGHRLLGQVQLIQDAISSPDREISRRATQIFGAFVQTLPSYQDILNAAGVQLTRPVMFNPFTGETTQDGLFRFDAAKGSFRSPRFASYDTYNALAAEWAPVQQALLVGNVANAKTALQNFKNVVNNLTNANVLFLDLRDRNNQLLDKADLLNNIDQAIQELTAFRFDLLFGGAKDDPALPFQIPVQNAGAFPLGQSISLTLTTAPASPGSLLLFGWNPQSAPSTPPPGFEYVDDDIFTLEAQDGLIAAGTIGISIEYGSLQLLGNPVEDPSALEIVRIANGQDYLLPTQLTDSDFVSAFYAPDASAPGSDQFGEFAIVEPVPEPASFSVLLTAITLFLLAGRLPLRS